MSPSAVPSLRFSLARALERRAAANGRPLLDEFKSILASLPPASDRQRLIDALTRRRKLLASRPLHGPDKAF